MEYKRQVPADTRKYSEPAMILDRDAPRFLWGDEKAGFVSDWIYGSSDDIHLMSFALSPGQRFTNSEDLKTFYNATETYYCVEGEFTFHCPETGEVQVMRKGDFLYLPPRTWHYGYNFGTTRCRILEAITPPTPEAVELFSLDQEPPETLLVDEGLLGSFPENTSGSNRTVLITPRDRLSEIVGSEHPIRVDLAASTDTLTTGAVRLFPGQWSERIEHPGGDKVVFVTEGTLHVRVWNTEEWYELDETDTCFLPKGTTHSLVNYTDDPTELVFSVAPAYR